MSRSGGADGRPMVEGVLGRDGAAPAGRTGRADGGGAPVFGAALWLPAAAVASGTTAATDAFKAFDTNGDGKLSQAELTSGLDSVAKKFADAISQYVGSGSFLKPSL